jgi:hypothetical protein
LKPGAFKRYGSTFETRKLIYFRFQGLKPGAFKLWVNCIRELVRGPATSMSGGGVGGGVGGNVFSGASL